MLYFMKKSSLSIQLKAKLILLISFQAWFCDLLPLTLLMSLHQVHNILKSLFHLHHNLFLHLNWFPFEDLLEQSLLHLIFETIIVICCLMWVLMLPPPYTHHLKSCPTIHCPHPMDIFFLVFPSSLSHNSAIKSYAFQNGVKL